MSDCLDTLTTDRLQGRFAKLYGEEKADHCMRRLNLTLGRYDTDEGKKQTPRIWNQEDVLLITYGDMVRHADAPPLATLAGFLHDYVKGAINTVHILPFFPYSSDDGFSVIDYREVDSQLGSWRDIKHLNDDFYLMFDLVLNHVSRQSQWFRDYVRGVQPASNFFIEANPDSDVSEVVRPRSSPLLTPTQTRRGERFVWTTFSDDQMDLNFANPDVLFEFLDILLFYAAMGARIIRLDAIAYLWKEIGTPCIHLDETHEVVKLMRDVLRLSAPGVLLLTETNVPHEENISYFGDGDEAEIVYQFSLPPLLLHALLRGDSTYLTEWATQLSTPPHGCTYLNFTASHDGIGVRPLEGILSGEELLAMIQHVKDRGGRVSCKANADGSESPYELNITYFDALGDSRDRDSRIHVARFMCSQTIAMTLQGIPAVYFNSLIGGRNYEEGVAETGRARTINRQKWDLKSLERNIEDPESTYAMVFSEYTRRLRIRAQQPAFHPDGPQKVYNLGPTTFTIERISPDGQERILSVSNVTPDQLSVALPPDILENKTQFRDLITGKKCGRADGSIRLEPYQTRWLRLDN